MRRRGKESWQITVELGRDPTTGRRLRRTHTIRGIKREAEQRRAALLHTLATGSYVEPSKQTVGAYLGRWLRDYARTGVAPATFDRYEEIVRLHLNPTLGAVPLTRLRPGHILAALEHWRKPAEVGGRALAPRTVLHHYRVLHEALQQAVRWQLLAINPVAAVSPPRADRPEMRALDRHQAARLLAALNGSEFESMTITALYTGARLGELRGLRWQDIDLARGSLSVQQTARTIKGGIAFGVPKTHRSRRSVALPMAVIDSLQARRKVQLEDRLRAGAAWQEGALVFTDALGRPASEHRLRHTFQRALTIAGLPRIRFHDLRHTMATLMLSQGEHPKVVSERLGHVNVNITLDTYSHVLPGLQEAAADRLAAALSEAGRTGA
jgi:integrase